MKYYNLFYFNVFFQFFQLICMENSTSGIIYDRQDLVATFLNDLTVSTIIEIGGGKNPIINYVKNKKFLVIDPHIKSKRIGDSEFIGKNLENVALPVCQNYAVVILGLQLHFTNEKAWVQLYDLINGAERTIIEYAADFAIAKKQIKNIRKNCNVHLVEEKPFQFIQKNGRDQKQQLRVLCILEKKFGD